MGFFEVGMLLLGAEGLRKGHVNAGWQEDRLDKAAEKAEEEATRVKEKEKAKQMLFEQGRQETATKLRTHTPLQRGGGVSLNTQEQLRVNRDSGINY